ncbi:MAG: hypothetical protein D6718_02730 [Acidobacteria bacterium]|nr:MAG: hypothetical protein D6718_02730 [Acidobacteriota bacterium]
MSAAKTTRRKKKDPHADERHVAAERDYAAAMKLYAGEQKWEAAASAFEKFIERYQGQPDVAEIVDRARVHLKACRTRLAPAPPRPENASEWLHQAVCLTNQGRFDEALAALDEAERGGAPIARVAYVRASALALAGRAEEALVHLGRAIEADPDNRAYCLGDPDFDSLREMPGYVALVEPPSEVAFPREGSSHAPNAGPESLEEPPAL